MTWIFVGILGRPYRRHLGLSIFLEFGDGDTQQGRNTRLVPRIDQIHSARETLAIGQRIKGLAVFGGGHCNDHYQDWCDASAGIHPPEGEVEECGATHELVPPDDGGRLGCGGGAGERVEVKRGKTGF